MPYTYKNHSTSNESVVGRGGGGTGKNNTTVSYKIRNTDANDTTFKHSGLIVLMITKMR